MNKLLIPILLLATCFVRAENVANQSPITMQQLMRALRVNGGNWTFRFEEPVYAKVVCTVSSYPDGKSTETYSYVSDSPESIIELYFMVGPWRVGDHQNPEGRNDYNMHIKLSNCDKTRGTAVVWFPQKFSSLPWVAMKDDAEQGEYKPSVARFPVLNKEYVLYYYYKKGDPYQVKATLYFMKSLDDELKVDRFPGKGIRDFKEADE